MTAAAADASLRSHTTRIDGDVDLLRLGSRSGLLWRRDGRTLAGIGRSVEIPLDRPGGFGPATAALAAIGPDAVAFAALPFDPDQPGTLIVPQVVLGADRSGRRWLTDIGPEPDADRALARVLSDPAIGTAADTAEPSAEGPTDFALSSVLAPETWRDDVVAPVRDRIRRGDLDKTVLARELRLRTDRPLQVPAVMDRLAAGFPQAILFLVDGFLGASPELLVSRHDDVVRAHPLAGTAARATDPTLDQRRVAELLASDKDRWEHRITIEWLLDNLLPFCSYVDAEPEPSIVTMANVHHLGTLVEGRLSQPSASVLELVAALHPTPAVGGSPQKDALALIAELERAERGRYAGPVGWVDGVGNGEFAVGIRSAELSGDPDQPGARFFAGVGVVGDSDPEAELAETRAKFRAMLGALLVP
jgi:menaquinone-specific isochorismate synthase